MLQQPERTKTGFEEFSAAAQPYLQMAFEYLMKKKLAEPGEKRAQAQEQRELEKEKREALTSVSKGEIPISTIPESIKSSIIRGPKIDTTGLAGRTAELANLPSSAQISGRPEFMRRVTPAETPEEAQARLMGSYAQQQQAINPYKALQAGKLDFWNKTLGVQAKEDPEKLRLFNMLFPQLAQNAEPVISPQSGVDEFGFKPGETRKGYKYIGNNKWQKY